MTKEEIKRLPTYRLTALVREMSDFMLDPSSAIGRSDNQFLTDLLDEKNRRNQSER